MRSESTPELYKARYDSLAELTDMAEANRHEVEDMDARPEFTGVYSLDEAFGLARDGWAAMLDDTMRVAEEAVSTVEQDLDSLAFVASHDVAGCEVDVARYLDGTPENMIDYPLTPIVKAGRVITVCASVTFSSAVTPESIIRRGQAVTALALALSRLGYSLEVYAEFTSRGRLADTERTVSVRTLIKGATDALDPERLAYALAHPSMLRVLNFAALRVMPAKYLRAIGRQTLGLPLNPIKDLPEGTLYLPCVRSEFDVPDADQALLGYLRELEILD